jgi:hypothetical protein
MGGKVEKFPHYGEAPVYLGLYFGLYSRWIDCLGYDYITHWINQSTFEAQESRDGDWKYKYPIESVWAYF